MKISKCSFCNVSTTQDHDSFVKTHSHTIFIPTTDSFPNDSIKKRFIRHIQSKGMTQYLYCDYCKVERKVNEKPDDFVKRHSHYITIIETDKPENYK